MTFKPDPRKGKLRNKILRMMFLIGFVPIVILGLLSFYSIKFFHDSDIASIENNLVNQKTEEINAFIQSIVSTFNIRVSFEQVGDIDLAGQYFILKQLFNQFLDIQEISFINLAGQETSRLNKAFPDGISSEELQNQSQNEKFLRAKSGYNYISPVYIASNGPTISVASPVFNRNGILISVISGEVSLENLQKIVERSQLGSAGYLYVMASDGFLVAHSQKDKLIDSKPVNISFVQKIINNDNISGQYRYDSLWGEQVVASGKYLDELKLGIIAEWPTPDADLILHTLNQQYLFVSIIVLIGTLILSLILASRIVKPIKTLEEGTRRIAQGRFNQPVLIKTGDEIEDLSIAFNDMLTGLMRLEELKKEFVFIAAHDLRTPVTAIKGYLSLVLDGSYGPLESTVKEILVKVTRANQRLVQLVNDLLQVARAEAGRIPIKVAAISVVGPINEVLGEIKLLADEKNINISYKPASDLPDVLADTERLKEIMVNLISNAIKYTLGSGKITIKHEITNNELVTHIIDTGIGMSIEAQKKLFEKYYRVENNITKDIQGTGLGLFIVKEIIEKMNGKIWVESEERKGSTFSFSLPIGS